MTLKQRIIAISAACALLLSGFAFGRVFDSPQSTSAEENKSALTQGQTQQAASENENFYLKDFKTGYDEGFQSGLNGQTANIAATDREGYNEGFKKGYADAYQNKQTVTQAPVAYRSGQQVVYKSGSYPAKKRSSKLKTVLTIAAPAAIGAGIGAAAGGKKGAGVGALVGGGGGALYHLLKNRDR